MITVKNTTEGIIPNLEIKGNTIQNPSNLSDIKSVGIDKGDGTYEVSILSSNGLEKANPEYKEDKCTIKLPCQLEKVGDFADRLYFDKVENAWCVDKHINTYIFKGDENITKWSNTIEKPNTTTWTMYQALTDALLDDSKITSYCESFTPFANASNLNNVDVQGVSSHKSIYLRILNANGNTVEDIKKYMKDKHLKYVSSSPRKIVLPLDTQIQLNQFFGTTHVWLECGEVGGTIKATFSKSMASTIQANTQSINKLDERVKGIEGLKESQDMAYATDKGYLVCKETKNGAVKDLKISGKSLVNLSSKKDFSVTGTGASNYDQGMLLHPISDGTEYTVIIKIPSDFPSDMAFIRLCDAKGVAKCNVSLGGELLANKGTTLVKRLTNLTNASNEPATNIRLFADSRAPQGTTFKLNDVIILEGDYTQNPPSYFEGIASVGTGVDKIEVSSMNNGNILNSELVKAGVNGDTGKLSISSSGSGTVIQQEIIPVVPNMKLYYKSIGERTFRDGGNTFLYKYGINNEYLGRDACVTFNPIDIPSNCYGVRVAFADFELSKDYPADKYGVVFSQFESFVDTPVKQDKKTILFKDVDGSWKPVTELRGLDTVCDTIELHADGKYYYHKRTLKLLFDSNFSQDNIRILADYGDVTRIDFIGLNDVKNANNAQIVCDKFNKVIISTPNVEGVNIHEAQKGTVQLQLKTSKLETKDAQGVIKYLKSNQFALITELAEEKVFEVNPLFLEAYEGETMMVVNSGVINAPMEFKLTSYLPNIVKLNEKRISKLENDFYQYTVVQNRLALTSRYNADRVDFKVDNTIGNPLRSSKALDHDLFNLMKVNIEVGKENYNRVEMEEKMDFYVNEGIIDWDMWDELFETMELQHNPPVDLISIEPIAVEVNEEETPKKTRRGRKKKVVEEI